MDICSNNTDWKTLLKRHLSQYENRAEQNMMIEQVQNALKNHEHLILEAGTGVGKTFAYLIPLLEMYPLLPKPIVISTSTIYLQDQLLHKDLPFIQELFGYQDLNVVLAKGKRNYLCYKKLMQNKIMQEDFFDEDDDNELQQLIRWGEESCDGDMGCAPFTPSAKLWNTMSCHSDTCFRKTCSYVSKCFFTKARDRLANADIILTNHHMLLSDIALKATAGTLLPMYETLIIDEAHRLSDSTEECFSTTISNTDIENLLKLIHTQLQYLPLGFSTQLPELTEDLKEISAYFFKKIFNTSKDNSFVIKEPLEQDIWNLTTILWKIKKELDFIILYQEEHKDRASPMWDRLLTIVQKHADQLDVFSECSLENFAFWGETHFKKHTLKATPLQISGILKNKLFDHVDRVILTSASLSVNSTLDYVAKTLGLEEAKQIQIPSPFNLKEQMAIFIDNNPKLMPNHPDYMDTLTESCLHFIKKTKGGAFVLFTNDSAMRLVYKNLKNHLLDLNLKPLCQNKESKMDILEQFHAQGNCVLFGLDSFWTGVDIRGKNLRNIIITKLPFPVPGRPVNSLKMKNLEKKGKNSFRHFMLPEALLKFKQGVGRLIRSHKDRGIVVILDPRVKSKGYGKQFLSLFGDCKVTLRHEKS
jgi:ATP-dependent DNA helicase DinG